MRISEDLSRRQTVPSAKLSTSVSASVASDYGVSWPFSPITNGLLKLRQAGPWLAWMSVPVFVILLVALAVGVLNQWDYDKAGYWGIQRDWFISLNAVFSTWPQQVWANLSELGSGEALILLLSPLLIWYPRAWAAMLCAAPFAAVLSAFIKYFAGVPRPAAVLDPTVFTVIGETLSARNSFPSGHSITVFTAAIAFMAALKLKPQLGRHWILLLVVVSVASLAALARVAVGAHWPLDVSVGASIGWISGLIGAMLARGCPGLWEWSQFPVGRRVLGAALLFAALSVMYVAQTTFYAPVTLWASVACGLLTSLWLLVGKSAVISPSQTTTPV